MPGVDPPAPGKPQQLLRRGAVNVEGIQQRRSDPAAEMSGKALVPDRIPQSLIIDRHMLFLLLFFPDPQRADDRFVCINISRKAVP